jgi:hypothetical protein
MRSRSSFISSNPFRYLFSYFASRFGLSHKFWFLVSTHAILFGFQFNLELICANENDDVPSTSVMEYYFRFFLFRTELPIKLMFMIHQIIIELKSLQNFFLPVAVKLILYCSLSPYHLYEIYVLIRTKTYLKTMFIRHHFDIL